MQGHPHRYSALWSLPLLLLAAAGPARPDARSITIAELIAGSAVPNTIKLKDLTADWRRMNVGGEAVLGMGAVQSMMQGVGSMFGGGGSDDALYTRGETVKLGDQEYLVGYRLPPQGLDLGALMAMGGAGGAAGGPPRLPQKAPITPETDLTLSLINLRSIASISDIRPYDMSEAMKPAAPGLLEGIFDQAKGTAQTTTALSNLKQLGLAVTMYAQDHNETLPPLQDPSTLKKALMPYVKDESVFRYSGGGPPFQANPRLSGRKLSSLKEPGSVAILYSPIAEPDGGRIVLFADGHAKKVTAPMWEKLAPQQGLPAQ